MRFVVIAALFASANVLAQSTDRQTIYSQLVRPAAAPDGENHPALVPENEGGRKSVFLATLFSLVVPGAGELYAGNYSRGQYFTIAEGSLWLTYGGFQVFGNLARTDARNFAAVNAGFNTAGKGDQFYVDIGNFGNVYQYNDKKLQDRRIDLLYDPAAGFNWQWNSDTNRKRFRDMRISSDNVLYNSRFVIAVVIANHLASAISAGNAAAEHNKSLSHSTGTWHWQISPQVSAASGVPDGIMLGIRADF